LASLNLGFTFLKSQRVLMMKYLWDFPVGIHRTERNRVCGSVRQPVNGTPIS
jgi:hypothetical protein